MNDQTVVIHKFHAPQTAEEIKDQVVRIQQVMRGVMKKGTHYDVIPGTQKPSLLKPGAEMLLSTFRIAVKPEVEDLSDDDKIRYRVHCRGVHMGTQVTVGEGVGECSSNEGKYKWRAALCQEEFDDTPEARRRLHYKKGYNTSGFERVQQIRTDPADSANTVLKMAKKRAEVDLCLTALACSDIFTQDMDSVPPAGTDHPKANQPPPRSTGGGNGAATPKQVNLLRAKMNGAPFSETDLCVAFEVEALEALPFAKVNDALAWIQNGGPS